MSHTSLSAAGWLWYLLCMAFCWDQHYACASTHHCCYTMLCCLVCFPQSHMISGRRHITHLYSMVMHTLPSRTTAPGIELKGQMGVCSERKIVSSHTQACCIELSPCMEISRQVFLHILKCRQCTAKHLNAQTVYWRLLLPRITLTRVTALALLHKSLV